jgi:hypothetical protein
MRRVLPVLLPLVLLAACDGGAALPAAPADPGNQVRASFPKGGLVDTIVIDAVERLPLRAADLVSADGGTTPASYINVTAAPSVATGQLVAGDPWQNALAGRGSAATLTVPNAQAGAALAGEAQLLATVSSADIPLPDPVAYRRDWRKYRIRLTFGTPPGEIETREIAAPAPPPPGS